MNKKKILYLYSDWSQNEYRIKNKAYGGVTYYRVIKPAQYLREWFDVDVMGGEMIELSKEKNAVEFMYNLFSGYDIIITKAIDNPQTCANIAFCCEKLGIPLVVDLDDDYFNVREEQPAYKYYYEGSQSRAIFASYISFASALFVSTLPLKEVYQKKLKELYNIDIPIFVLPNSFDFSDFTHQTKKQEKIVIGYAGSNTHNLDLKVAIPAIKIILERNKNVEFLAVGAVTTEFAMNTFSGWEDDTLNRIYFVGGTEAFDKYPEYLASMGFTLGIAPLIDDQFNRGKSHIKWMEYAAIGIPTIASPVYPYKEKILGKNVIEHNKTGLFASNTDEWIKYIQKLIDDKQLREKLVKNARKQIEKEWLYKSNVILWKKAIENILKL